MDLCRLLGIDVRPDHVAAGKHCEFWAVSRLLLILCGGHRTAAGGLAVFDVVSPCRNE